ncbi:MAG: hypothetical protein JWP42_2424 [Pseudomonas sp.]|nr:hypothetical protein [Pseudomonas sp.]
MILDTVILPEAANHEAAKLLVQIERAGSMIVAVKAGARADGFVLGLETAGVLRDGDGERLHSFFDAVLEERLKTLSR